jgi:hypothetical protein
MEEYEMDLKRRDSSRSGQEKVLGCFESGNEFPGLAERIGVSQECQLLATLLFISRIFYFRT